MMDIDGDDGQIDARFGGLTFGDHTPASLHLPAPSTSTNATPSTSSSTTPKPSKARTSHARKVAPGHIKRPPNTFILYRSHCCNPSTSGIPLDAPGTPTAQQLANLNITDHRHISRIASILWSELGKTEKGYWEGLAKERKEQHARDYPDYKFKPVYRDPEGIRRRRVHEGEIKAEREACEDVAYALLEAQGKNVERPFPSEDSSEDSTGSKKKKKSQGKKKPSPKSSARSSRRASPKGKAPAAALAEPTTTTAVAFSPPTLDDLVPPPQLDFRPHSAPTGEHYSLQTFNRRRPSAVRSTTSYGTDEQLDSDHFQFMAMLETVVDPRDQHQHLGHGGMGVVGDAHRPQTALPFASIHDPSLAIARSQPPATSAGVPYNPTFFFHPELEVSGSQTMSTSQPQQPLQIQPEADFFPSSQPASHATDRPFFGNYSMSPQPHSLPTSSALSHLSHLTPDPRDGISPTSTTFVYADGRVATASSSLTPAATPHPQAAPLLHHPHSNLLREGRPSLTLSGMKRRGTLGRSAAGGDLMLISPTNGEFGGRRFSLGRWEVSDAGAGGEGQPGAGEGIAAFEFDQELLYSLRGNAGDAADAHAPPSSAFSPPSDFVPLTSLGSRPGTAASAYAGDTEKVGWEHGKSTDVEVGGGEPLYHFAGSEFFDRPGDALGAQAPALSQPMSFTHSSASTSSDASRFAYSVPTYDFPAGVNTQHRPSIDALLGSQMSDYQQFAMQSASAGGYHAWARNANEHRGSEATIRYSARDASVQDKILAAGFGVTYDYDEGMPLPPTAEISTDYQTPSTARASTFDHHAGAPTPTLTSVPMPTPEQSRPTTSASARAGY
ncbi:hypothetical protein MNV49_003127 [Pseudohyphozyma bogoriensis]|nr:hypothetical protein MNV49_003127 [Pseudohyphozyma bogoriensis]